MQKAQASVKKSVKRDVKKAQAAVKQVQTSVKRDVKRVQVNVGKDVRKAQVAVRKVETQAKQAAVAVEKKIAAVSEPMIAAAVNITPSPLSRAFLATSSEEHTSELKSIMRISYAVFCLKNKNKK